MNGCTWVVAGIAAALTVAPENPNRWERVLAEDGVTVWSRDVPGSDFREVRGETTIDLPAADIWRVLGNVGDFREFMPYTVESRVLSTFAGGHYSYVLTDPPVVSRRDYAAKSVDQVDAAAGIYRRTIHEANDHAPPKPDGVVRMRRMRGSWLVTAVSARRTKVVYQFHADPGGSVPAWIVNARGSKTVPEVFASLVNRARNPRWTRD